MEKKFYRYEAVEYANVMADGDFQKLKIPNIKIQLREFNLLKETPKGYWIGFGFPSKLKGQAKWVLKTSVKKFAYLSKEDALNNFIKRTERRIKIL